MNPLVIIPARGGSKGVPGKNIVDLGGKPLICHTIDAAREVVADDRICISTDSEDIASAVRAYGVEVPFMRPAELASDKAGTYEVLLHALKWYEDNRNFRPDTVILLQPTSPFRTGHHLSEALSLWTPDLDMVVSVAPAKTNPYLNCYEENEDGFLNISLGEGRIKCRQDAPDVWEYNGAIYIINTDSLLAGPLSGFKRRRKYVMTPEDSVDIDTPLDLDLARLIYERKNLKPNQS